MFDYGCAIPTYDFLPRQKIWGQRQYFGWAEAAWQSFFPSRYNDSMPEPPY